MKGGRGEDEGRAGRKEAAKRKRAQQREHETGQASNALPELEPALLGLLPAAHEAAHREVRPDLAGGALVELEVRGDVGARLADDAVVRACGRAHHALPPGWRSSARNGVAL